MSSQPATAPALPTHCRFCGFELLRPGAKKCSECGELQRVPDRLLGKISIGDFALFGSIIFLLATTVGNFARGESAHVEMRTLSCSKGKVTAALFNSGTIDGVVTDLHLFLLDPAPALLGDLAATENNAAPQSTFVLPVNAGPKVVTFAPSQQTRNNLSTAGATPASRCEVRATKYEQDVPDSREVKGESCPCSAF